jgi:hypothetical protein
MNKRQILASLSKIANELDNIELYQEANIVTKILVRLSAIDLNNPIQYSTEEETEEIAQELKRLYFKIGSKIYSIQKNYDFFEKLRIRPFYFNMTEGVKRSGDRQEQVNGTFLHYVIKWFILGKRSENAKEEMPELSDYSRYSFNEMQSKSLLVVCKSLYNSFKDEILFPDNDELQQLSKNILEICSQASKLLYPESQTEPQTETIEQPKRKRGRPKKIEEMINEEIKKG